jgi:hypothetical protein
MPFNQPALVQGPYQGIDDSNYSTISVTLGAAPANNDFLVACIVTLGTTVGTFTTVSSITQPGVVWTQLLPPVEYFTSTSRYMVLEVWGGVVGPGAGTLATVNLSGFPDNGAVADICEWSNLLTSGFLDQTGSVNTTGSSTNGPTGITSGPTSQAVELVCGFNFAINGNPMTVSNPQNRFTQLDGIESNPTGGINFVISYLVLVTSSQSVYSSGVTINVASNNIGAIVTLKATPIITAQVYGDGITSYTC